MSTNRIFIDTGILIHSTDASSSLQNAAMKALQKARERGFELIVSQQVLREYLTINTQADAATGKDMPLQNVIEQTLAFRTAFTVVRETEEVLSTLIDLLQEFPVTGNCIWHANIVATMLVYKIEHLLTHDVNVYRPFSGKIHIVPLEKWGIAEHLR